MILVQAVNAHTVPGVGGGGPDSAPPPPHRRLGRRFHGLLAASFLDIARTITGVLTIFLGGIAAISLLVGGIGIMNIMLVSVTERTARDRPAQGAGRGPRRYPDPVPDRNLVLSLIGGIIGIGLGWAISYAVGQIAAANDTQINPSIGMDTILMATLFSTAVGLFFGLYPANRAANLEPVEALRYE